MPRIGLALATAALAPLAFAPSASALERWSRTTVTYSDRSAYPNDVAIAADQWNALLTPVHLVRVPPGRRANIVLTTVYRASVDWDGVTYATTDGADHLLRARIQLNSYYLGNSGEYVAPPSDTVAHEFGHALGLSHTSAACALMGPSGVVLDTCDVNESNAAEVRCGPQRPDLIALIHRYGGSTGGFESDFCDVAGYGPTYNSSVGGCADRHAPQTVTVVSWGQPAPAERCG